jgi:protein TonB
MVRPERPVTRLHRLRHSLLVGTGAAFLTLVFFLVLPFIQAISKPPASDLQVVGIDTASLPPPPPPMEEEPEEEEPEEEPPPELEDEAPPLDLSELELALGGGIGDGWMNADFAAKLGTMGGGGDSMDALYSIADLDQKPRVIHQPGPVLNAKLRARAPGKVDIIFIVDPQGRVENPIVRRSTDPIFEAPALSAVKQWKFEPGKRNGEPVRFRMLVPITFPEA